MVPLVAVDDDAVVVSAVKLADDRSGDVVVRLYESHGGRARARLTTGLDLDGVTVCDLLERPLDDVQAGTVTVTDDALELALRPFQLLTLRFAVPGAAR